MRIRAIASYTALTCAGAALVAVASCVTSSNPTPLAQGDASLPEDGSTSPPIDSTVADTSSPVGDAGDSGAPAADAASPPDAADANPGCAPMAITGFVVPPYVHAVGSILDCNNGESATLGTDCYSDASTPATCAGFADSGDEGGAVSAQCLGCLFTPEGSDAGYGPIIEGVVPVINVGGCIERADQSDAGFACAQAVQAAWECAEYSCKASCPVTDDASRAAYMTCARQAATGVCSAYTASAQACVAAEQADSGAPTQVQMQCFDGTTPLLEYFCGS